jgi:hypothetical protein
VQGGAPNHRTNDIDTDQRRRTIKGSPDKALDNLTQQKGAMGVRSGEKGLKALESFVRQAASSGLKFGGSVLE